MQHLEEAKQATDYLRRVVPLLTQHKLAPTPINYSVFYAYLSGLSPSLKNFIDQQIEAKKPFTVAIMIELYEKYVNGTAAVEQHEKIQSALEKVLADTTEEITHINEEASDFDSLLSKHAEALESTNDSQATSMVLQQILQDTRHMVKANEEANKRMQAANSEILKIKAELESVKASAEQDSLTGLKNRGTFDKAMEQFVYQPNKEDKVLMMLDIDHFKRINDNFGHLVGDRVIRYLAALLKQIVGEEQTIARYGGEEFAVILNDHSQEKALALADKIRVSMANSKLQRKDSGETIGKVTVSCGIAMLGNDDDVETLIERADKALYEAKETGRNKVVIA